MTSLNRLNNRPSSQVLFTQKQVKFLRSCTTKHHPSTQEMNASTRISPISLSLSQVFSNKRAAFRECTPTQHVQPAHSRAGAQRRTSAANENPPWRDTIIRATPSHNATFTKTQTAARRCSDSSGESFVSRSLTVLCRRPQ